MLNRFAQKPKNNKGFTLIELIVSVGIFALIMTTALGSLTTILSVNRKTRATQLVMDNLQFAVDEMMRHIRTGDGYIFPVTSNDCTNVTFSFTDASSDTVTYRCSEGVIQKKVGSGNFVDMTAPEITVTRLKFIQKVGADQPLVLVLVAGEVESDEGDIQAFSLQTLVSQRFTGN